MFWYSAHFVLPIVDAPAAAGYTSVKSTREELEVTEGIGIRKNTDYTTLEEAKNEYESGSFALVDVRDYKQVRFPSLASTLYGAVLSVAAISQSQAIKYARNRGKGFQLFDWEMHKDAGNLHFFKYGNTDSQGVCGYGTANHQKVTGLTNALGMRDTVSYYKEKGGSNPQAEGAYRDGVNYQSVNVLGYENFQGNKSEWLQCVTVYKTATDGRWFITMPDGTERIVQGITVYNADIYPTHMVWGRYMDLIAAKEGGSTSSHWFDRFYVGNGLSRVVYRSYNYADVLGGVSFASVRYDSSAFGLPSGASYAGRAASRPLKP